MMYGRYGTTKQIEDNFKVIIYVRDNRGEQSKIIKQLEVCQNFADFHDYDVVGVATEIKTLFNTAIEYDGVLVTEISRISRKFEELKRIKQELLKRDKIIITAVRS